MVERLQARCLELVSKLRRNPVLLWVPYAKPRTGRTDRPHKYSGRFDRARFQIEFNFRDAKQHLDLAGGQARHHFHLNAVLAALTWTRLELRQAADRALDCFSIANVKLKSSPMRISAVPRALLTHRGHHRHASGAGRTTGQ